MRLSVSHQRRGSIATVAVSGEVDLAAGPVLENAIVDAVAADGVETVLVDLSGVEFLDSSGIATLLKGRRSADGRGVAYSVTGAHGIVLQVLQLTGVWAHLSGGSTSSQPTVT